ncbi:unnamed protein product [Mucor circinelloides]|uniref:BHLH domain-containing protein n=1 Tax=Mucor circinelloides f. circinelloides (strain 1006PhL) TaxID=1220926 RepID=S2JGJ8_MUCC1|nr:hypothetical protein HMPREF1544_11640 [Mucor circinelloides 1006PhL]
MNPIENSFLDQQQQQDQQNLLNQLQYDLLAFDNMQFLPNEYDSNGSNVASQGVSFLPQNALSTPLPTPNYCTPPIHPHAEELEEFLTPLVSPAITPSFNEIYQFLDPPNEQYFTPLSSPALLPNADQATLNIPSDPINSTHDPTALAQQLAQIEAKQSKLREQMKISPAISPTYRKSPLAMLSNRSQAPPSPLPFNNNNSKKRPSLRQKIALASPQLHSSQNHHISLPTIPATPGSLMRMSHHLSQAPLESPIQERELVDIMPSLPPSAVVESSSTVKKRKLAPSSPITTSSPRSLKPLISPFLQPDLRNSNLINQVQTPGIENRRSAHKVAEQRRRDTLKQSFDSLRKEIVDVMVNDSEKKEESVREEKEKEVKLMSKVLLLQHSYEYIVRLKTDSRLKDDKISTMQAEINRLKELTQISKE